MNTIENNKIIAEFMGFKLQDNPNERFFNQWFMQPTEIAWSNREKILFFDCDWNWLMEVVEKIFKDFYKLNPCPIYLKMEIEKQLITVNKEAVCNACIEFIKWYNENK